MTITPAAKASYVVYGSRSRDYALADVARKSTLYSQALLECLDKRARPDDDGRTVLYTGLQDALATVVPELAKQYGEEQETVFGGVGGGRVPVHRRRVDDALLVRGGGVAQGRVVIRSSDPTPLSIRGPSGEVLHELRAESWAGAEMALPPGTYTAVVSLPWGGEQVAQFEVAATVAPVEVGVTVPATPQIAADELPRLAQQLANPAPEGPAQAEPVRGRFLTWVDGGFKLCSVPSTPRLRAAGGGLRVDGRRPVYLQLGWDGAELVVALPLQPGGGCLLHVTTGERGLRAAVRFADPNLDAMAGYLASGRPDRSLAGLSEELLLWKVADPFAAALGGYALLTLNELERMHDWPENLAHWFPWLPDGPVIAALLAARTGRPDDAAAHLMEAARRGLPMFSSGLSSLTSEVASLERRGDLAVPALDELRRVTGPVRGLAPTALFGSVVTMLTTDVDLPGDGWFELPGLPGSEP